MDVGDTIDRGGVLVAEAACWARDIINTPSNDKAPETFAKAAQSMLRGKGVRVQVLGPDEIRRARMGGVIGVVLGILGGNATAWYFEVPPAIPADWIMLGLVICSIVGIVFGTYPAYKAANLDPIESLRYE